MTVKKDHSIGEGTGAVAGAITGAVGAEFDLFAAHAVSYLLQFDPTTPISEQYHISLARFFGCRQHTPESGGWQED